MDFNTGLSIDFKVGLATGLVVCFNVGSLVSAGLVTGFLDLNLVSQLDSML